MFFFQTESQSVFRRHGLKTEQDLQSHKKLCTNFKIVHHPFFSQLYPRELLYPLLLLRSSVFFANEARKTCHEGNRYSERQRQLARCRGVNRPSDASFVGELVLLFLIVVSKRHGEKVLTILCVLEDVSTDRSLRSVENKKNAHHRIIRPRARCRLENKKTRTATWNKFVPVRVRR